MAIRLVLCAVIGYLLGNVSMGILVSRKYNTDIRKEGSGNPGATNVLRTLGWLPSVLTLVGDALKGFLSAAIGYWIAGGPGMLTGGFFAIVGHNWPVFFGFRGGKGMAAALGVVMAVNWWMGLILLVIEVGVSYFTGYVSLASIITSFLYPVVTVIYHWGRADFAMYLVFSVGAAAMTIFGHRANIQRLIAGTENRINFKKIQKKPNA